MFPSIKVGATRYSDPRDVPLAQDLIDIAERSHMTLSALLEEIQPNPDSGLDAYERQLARFNIRSQPDHQRGIPASRVEEFWNPRDIAGQPLAQDQWLSDDGKRFFASNQPQSWALFPEYINRLLRYTPLPADVLDELISNTEIIDSGAFQSVYLNDSAPARRMSRVGEGAELPRMFVQTSIQSVALGKYGVMLETTYEVVRRLRLPIFETILMRVRQQIRLDMSAEAAYVLVNGDGNSNPAINYNISNLDSAAPAGPGTVYDPYLQRIGDPNPSSTISKLLTYKAFLTWRTASYPLPFTAIVGRMNEILQVLTLQMPTINPTLLLALLNNNANSVGMGKVEIGEGDLWGNVKLIYLPFAPPGVLIGLNKTFALQMLMEQNSDITETDKDIKSQKNYLTISQSVDFDKIISSASSTLTFA